MPFAPHPGGVPGVREGLRTGDLPAGQTVRAAADRDGLGTRSQGVPPGEQRRSAGRALRLDVEVQEPVTLFGERVDPRGRGATEDPAAIAADLAPPEVVPEEHHDVRLCAAHEFPIPVVVVHDALRVRLTVTAMPG